MLSTMRNASAGTTTPWGVFAIASGAVFLVSLDATIAVAAFPALRNAFANATPALLSWVLNAYTIVYAALLVPSGRLADLIGRRKLFGFGVAVFTGASVACGLVSDPHWLILSRAAQALGGAFLTPASLALILASFPKEKRASIVGLWSAVGALGAAIGPAAGAAIIEATSWRSVFLLNLPVGLLIAWLAFRRLPESLSPETGARLDLVGLSILILGVGALTLGIVQVETWGLASAWLWGAIGMGLALLGLYPLYARGRSSAALDLDLFADRTYAMVTLASLIFGIGFSVMFLSSYLFLITIWGFGPAIAGLALMPGPLVVIPVAIATGRIAPRIGFRPLLMVGGALHAATNVLLFSLTTSLPSYWTLWFPLQLVGGTAVGLLLASLSGAAVSNLPPTRFGVGGAVNNAVRQLGGVFGAAIAVVLIGDVSADLSRFHTAFLTIAGVGVVVAGLAAGLRGSRPARVAASKRAR